MATDAVDRPKDDGRMKLPKVDSAMNKVAPRSTESAEDDRFKRLSVAEDGERAAKILARARRRLEDCIQEDSQNRKDGLDDLKFKTGEGQWPPDVAAQRSFDKRPCLTVNKLPTFINQVTNDARQNRPAIHFLPVGDRADRRVAEILNGFMRAIWRNSVGDIALDTALDTAASIGWGYFRVLTDWEAPDSMDQEILIKRVRNAFSIYLDPKCQQPDCSDARFGYFIEDWDRAEFEDEWPNADPMPWDKYGIGNSYKNWGNEKQIRVAEYFEIEQESRTLVQLENGHVGWYDELDEITLARIRRDPDVVIKSRESRVPKVHWYKLTAIEILEDREWPGRWVPLPRVVGNEIDVDGRVKLSGIIRNAKVPQLIYNYMRTLEIEHLAQAPKAPWLIAEGQDEGYEGMWATTHIRARPNLKWRPVYGPNGQPLPPPTRIGYPGAVQGIEQATQMAAQDFMGVTGIRFDATRQERMYDESGRALRELRRAGDLGTFHYVDNLAVTLRHIGEIVMDLIPKVYDTRRNVTIIREDDKEEQVIIDPSAPQAYSEERHPMTGKKVKVFNPTLGKYGVAVTIGPSYATKRVEASESMMDFVRAIAPAAPNLAAAVADLIAKNQDWPQADEFATRLAKLVEQANPGITAPDTQDVSPQVQALLRGLDQQVKQLSTERQALMQQIADQTADRLQRQDKINKDFEAKLLAILQKGEGAQLKAEAQEAIEITKLATLENQRQNE